MYGGPYTTYMDLFYVASLLYYKKQKIFAEK